MTSHAAFIAGIWILISVFVGADAWAEERGGIKWFLIVSLTGIFGAGYYFMTD